MRALIFLAVLGALAFAALECIFFWQVSGWTSRLVWGEAGHDVITTFAVLFILMFVGWRIAAWHIKQIPMAFFAGRAGRHFIGALGGVLLVIPGFLTDIVGLFLILPPVQMLLASLGNKLVAVLAQQAMGRMMGGKMPGGFGGMAGMGGFPGFGGGKAAPKGPAGFGGFGGLQADDRQAFPGMRQKPGKIIDVTAEK
jgi:hypothetical protein